MKLLSEFSDKDFMKSFAKGVMASKDLDPDDYEISVVKKSEEPTRMGVAVFSIFFAWIGMTTYTRWLLFHHAGYDISADLYFGVSSVIQILIYPFIFALIKPEKIFEISSHMVLIIILSFMGEMTQSLWTSMIG